VGLQRWKGRDDLVNFDGKKGGRRRERAKERGYSRRDLPIPREQKWAYKKGRGKKTIEGLGG